MNKEPLRGEHSEDPSSTDRSLADRSLADRSLTDRGSTDKVRLTRTWKVLHGRKTVRLGFWLQAFPLQLSSKSARQDPPSSGRCVDRNLCCLSGMRKRISLRLAGNESHYVSSRAARVHSVAGDAAGRLTNFQAFDPCHRLTCRNRRSGSLIHCHEFPLFASSINLPRSRDFLLWIAD